MEYSIQYPMEKQARPNILLLMTDQQRGDALGIEGHPVLQTPYLDALAVSGTRFTHAYSACPICIPARRTLMTGKTPHSHGVFTNFDTHLDGPTLPELLGAAGYQTHLAGKLHLWPKRKRYGFHSMDLADGLSEKAQRGSNDYVRFLAAQGISVPDAARAHGMNDNGWPARPWHLEERLHITNWTADRALDFLDRRDPTVPFFLKVSFLHPHQPCVPPEYYFNLYLNMELPEPAKGDWANVDNIPRRGVPVNSPRINPDPQVMRQFQAGYYGCITHIDHQIGRILAAVPENTIIIFTSDHGEMLGDHGRARKTQALEGAARIPFLVKLPKSAGVPQGNVIDAPVELMDIMPTLLDAAGLAVPDTVDGRSVMSLIRGEDVTWREAVHGETSALSEMDDVLKTGLQYLTDGKRKYVWYPGTGDELFFNLETDPRELNNLADTPEHQPEVERWRARLVEKLKDRPENFVEGGRLRVLGGITPGCRPEYQREGMSAWIRGEK